MSVLFQELFLEPFFNFLILIYNALPRPDLGVAVILFIVFLRLLLWPLYVRVLRSQILFAKLQPEVERIQKKHKDDRVTQTQELLALYKKERFNPFGGFLVLILQVFVILALYRVFLRGVHPTDFSLLWTWVKNPGALDPMFLGVVNLSQPFFLLAVLAGIAQFLEQRTLAPKKKGHSFQANFAREMVWLGPILTVVALSAWKLPSIIALYWAFNSLVSTGQQFIIRRQLKGIIPHERETTP